MDMLLLVDNYYIGASGSCSGIYCFENLIDGKKYVGKANVLINRKNNHIWTLNSENYKDSKYFQRVWNKVGKENFKLYILEECPIELLNEKEIYWIKELHSHVSEWGYNLTWGGGGVNGYKHTEESIQKMKKPKPEGFGLKMSLIMKGKKKSKEAIEKMIKSKTGSHFSDAIREKMSLAATGRICTEETRYKISIAKKGRKHSSEHIEKIRISKTGKKISDEARLNRLGSKSSNAKLNEEQVYEIKKMLSEGISGSNISKIFNVSKDAIYAIKNGETWKQVVCK